MKTQLNNTTEKTIHIMKLNDDIVGLGNLKTDNVDGVCIAATWWVHYELEINNVYYKTLQNTIRMTHMRDSIDYHKRICKGIGCY